MAIRYRNRTRRLERTISRIEAARRAIGEHKSTAAEHDAWWRQHGPTLQTWRRAILQRQRRRPGDGASTALDRFKRWSSRLRFHPAVLRLRLECWWLTRKLRRRGLERGPGA